MTASFTPLDWAVLSGYFLATMAVGVWFGLRNGTAEGFTAAGRSLPGWVCGLSIMATYLSSISFLALPGKAFAGNWNPFAFSLSIPLAALIAATIFIPRYRQGTEVSAYAHLERRFGTWARVYAGGFYLLTQIARMGTVMYLMALPLQILLGVDIRTLVIFTGVSVTVYSFIGGITAVIWTDALQACVLMVGTLVCLAVLASGLPAGVPGTISAAFAAGRFSLGSHDLLDLSAATVWVVLLYGVTLNLQNFGIDQSYVQRYIAARSDAEARKAVWLGGLLYVPVSALFLLIGTGLSAYYAAVPADLGGLRTSLAEQRLADRGAAAAGPGFSAQVAKEAAAITDEELGDRVFPHFIGTALPPGVRGLLIAAVFAAAMSTVSTSLNSVATLTLTDWYLRFWRPGAGERESLWLLRLATVAWGIAGTGMALLLVNVASALDAWWALSGIFGGGMLGLFLLGLLSRTAGSRAGVLGVIAGVVVIAALSLPSLAAFLGGFPESSLAHSLGSQAARLWPAGLGRVHAFLIPVIGTAAILAIGMLTAVIGDRRDGGRVGPRGLSSTPDPADGRNRDR
jgi:solute:Na+ symporter, SSS family